MSGFSYENSVKKKSAPLSSVFSLLRTPKWRIKNYMKGTSIFHSLIFFPCSSLYSVFLFIVWRNFIVRNREIGVHLSDLMLSINTVFINPHSHGKKKNSRGAEYHRLKKVAGCCIVSSQIKAAFLLHF